MASLNDHQSESTDHDRLGFHPDCPACRQDRLFGVFSPEPVFSYGVRVFLAAGVLALSAGAATTSVAAETDSNQEGVSLPQQDSSPTPGTSTGETPDSATGGQQGGGAKEQAGDDLGQGSGGETALPIEVDPLESAPSDGAPGSATDDVLDDGVDDAAPLETAPTEDPDDGLALTDPDSPDAIDADDVPAPPSEADPPVVPAPPAVPPVDWNGQPESTWEPTPPTTEGQRHEAWRVGHRRRSSDPGAQEQADNTAPAPPATAALPVDVPALSVPAQDEPAPAVEASASPTGKARFHVVRAGESLWSIASDLSGPSPSTTAIALEVQRLWELNKERIGTGDPDLLTVGVKLRLR